MMVINKQLSRIAPILTNIIQNWDRVHSIIPHLPKKYLLLIIKLLGNIIKRRKGYQVPPKYHFKTRNVLHPFRSDYLYLSKPESRLEVVNAIRKQNGRGFFLSSLIAAAIPLISSFLKKILKK